MADYLLTPKSKDISGQRFNRLVPQKPINKRGRVYWLCDCDCGGATTTTVYELLSGHTKSCGCLQSDNRTKHGLYKSREYSSWMHAKRRCYDSKNYYYKDYGGRGIRMCMAWLNNFETFYRDMGPCPPKCSIDRYPDNNGHYCCGHCNECVENGWSLNCRWATELEQHSNTRKNRYLNYAGQIKTIREWARHLGINHELICYRLKAGWSVDDCLSKVSHRGPNPQQVHIRWHVKRNAPNPNCTYCNGAAAG